jgi:hypothetical protein
MICNLTDVYAEIRRREEARCTRLGGHRILTDRGVATINSPGTRLYALRAGRPVEINDWQLPRWARSGMVQNRRVTLHSDGRVVEMEW